MTPRLLAALALLAALDASAQARGGAGRVSLMPGWRYTPNGSFTDSAEAAGHPLQKPSPGGPQLTGTFAYAATDSIEAAIDLFGGYETLQLTDADELTSVTYGALLGFRAFTQWGSWVPNFGFSLGPVLVYTSGGLGERAHERLVTGYSASAGISLFLSESLSLTADVRVLLARGLASGIGGINGGGVWGGVGLTWWIASEPSRPGSVR